MGYAYGPAGIATVQLLRHRLLSGGACTMSGKASNCFISFGLCSFVRPIVVSAGTGQLLSGIQNGCLLGEYRKTVV